MKIKIGTLTIRFRKPTLQTKLLFLWFFELLSLTVARFILSKLGFFEGTARTIVLWAIAAVPVLVFLLHLRELGQKKYMPFLILFLFVALAIILSVLANPALGEFFTRANYGLERVLRPDCALYAFLFFSIFDNPVELRKNVCTYAYIDFAYLFIVQLLPALLRGYWIDIPFGTWT